MANDTLVSMFWWRCESSADRDAQLVEGYRG